MFSQIQVVFAFLVGSIALGLVLPELAYFTRAQAAAKSIFLIIERVSSFKQCNSSVYNKRKLLKMIFSFKLVALGSRD